MRGIFPALLTLTAVSAAQFIENSCPSPGGEITGLAEWGVVYAVDPLENQVYEFDGWTGEVYDTIPVPFANCSPVGLAVSGDSLVFAGGGSAMLYVMSMDGSPIGTYDLSDSGVFSISGICRWEDLYIADDSTSIIWRTDLPLGSGPLTQFLALEGCPRIHDIGIVYWDMVAVACEDPVSPVRIYFEPDEYWPIDFQPGECESAVGVGTCGEGNRFWFSDPEMGMIHRYCCDMGGVSGEDPEPAVGISMPNPLTGSAVADVRLSGAGTASITVTDMAGRTVTGVFEGSLSAGTNRIPLDLCGFPAGSYLLRVTFGDITASRQFTVLPHAD